MIGQTLTGMSATDLGGAIRERRVSAREVVEAHVNRIEAVDARLNAVVIPTFERALAEADLADEAIARGEPVGPLLAYPSRSKSSSRSPALMPRSACEPASAIGPPATAHWWQSCAGPAP